MLRLITVLLLLPLPALAKCYEPIEIEVVSGDTFIAAGERIRLEGIDALEVEQVCTVDRRQVRCGETAVSALNRLVRQFPVCCRTVRHGADGSIQARCFAQIYGEDYEVNDFLVSAGHALADRSHSLEYVESEARAKEKRLGLWAGEFTPPWDWRKENP